ncbi:MAG: hypothetical protein KatS3mg106_690 [Gemmataceae bacterium]|nr:MAG: hypothetical protein KatS3mg106_690 [Gemmataceae bacterium]
MKRWRFIIGCGIIIMVVLMLGVSAFVRVKMQEHIIGMKAGICSASMRMIGRAMECYHDKYGHFPPAYVVGPGGKPAHSWRVLLLEFLKPELYHEYRFDEPWDGPNNRRLADKMPFCYACPADSGAKRKRQTNYFVVIGPRTVFPGAQTVKLSDIQRPHEETILIVEAVGLGVHWMEPRDLDWETLSVEVNDPTRPSISSKHNRYGPFVYTIGRGSFRINELSPERVREMLLIAK